MDMCLFFVLFFITPVPKSLRTGTILVDNKKKRRNRKRGGRDRMDKGRGFRESAAAKKRVSLVFSSKNLTKFFFFF